ncbi:chromate transporter [Mycoplasmopsis pullorum]|uniref:chromate transporter n=1 Tax=Mycoplasmopsis pullorum TaxID=48003 RepID=UPI00111882D0|nr:chromate transporter [Mycoplasmopsis pullorum]TNK88663.1 chromate transporter [Mycoplasmopsis pullorum]
MKNKFWPLFIFVLKVMIIGFGGGNAIMPVIKSEAVEKKKWLTIEEFDRMVIVTNMLPGPSVIQAISFLAIKNLGIFKGVILTLFAIFPHILIALILYLLASYLPINYLYAISIGALSVIAGVLLSFGWSYMTKSKNMINTPLWLLTFLVTLVFCVFVPSPFNLPIFVMIVFFLILGIVQFCLFKKSKKIQKGDK